MAQEQQAGGKPRVARLLLCHALRWPGGSHEMGSVISNGRSFSMEADGLAVEWPEHRADLSAEMCAALRVKAGGYDLSDGAEQTPVMWVNAIDRPPIRSNNGPAAPHLSAAHAQARLLLAVAQRTRRRPSRTFAAASLATCTRTG